MEKLQCQVGRQNLREKSLCSRERERGKLSFALCLSVIASRTAYEKGRNKFKSSFSPFRGSSRKNATLVMAGLAVPFDLRLVKEVGSGLAEKTEAYTYSS